MFHNGIRSSDLKILDLCAENIDSQALLAIVISYGETLRELRLHSMHLKDERSWEELSNELDRSLQLHCITLMSISDENEPLWSDKFSCKDLRAVKMASRFMQRTAQQLKKIAAAGVGMVMTWSSEVFRPRFKLNRSSDVVFPLEAMQ